MLAFYLSGDDMQTLADVEALQTENASLRARVAQLERESNELRLRSKLVVPPEFLKVLSSMLHSRKVLLALAGLIQTVALNYYGVDPAVWLSIDGLLVAAIGSIAYEDGAAKSAPVNVQNQTNVAPESTPS
jgi:hypothetical protein